MTAQKSNKNIFNLRDILTLAVGILILWGMASWNGGGSAGRSGYHITNQCNHSILVIDEDSDELIEIKTGDTQQVLGRNYYNISGSDGQHISSVVNGNITMAAREINFSPANFGRDMDMVFCTN